MTGSILLGFTWILSTVDPLPGRIKVRPRGCYNYYYIVCYIYYYSVCYIYYCSVCYNYYCSVCYNYYCSVCYNYYQR